MKKFFAFCVLTATCLCGCSNAIKADAESGDLSDNTMEGGKMQQQSPAADAETVKALSALNDKWGKVVKYNPEKVEEELNEYAAAYPEFLKVESIGKSVEGRPLLMLKMGKGKTHIFGLATIHAREYISTAMVMKDIEQMVLCHAKGTSFGSYNVRDLFDDCTYYLVPMMNPDGVVISQNGPGNRGEAFRRIPIDQASRAHGYSSWKANANGVDLNRNYPEGWKENRRSPAGPNSNEYKGPKPYSEPETNALVAALDNIKPVAVISYHTQGEILYISDPTPLDKELGKKISQITGYPRRPAGRPYGSLQDYIDDVMKVFYVCVELCPSVGPYPYPENKFFTNVWPRARYVMPLVGNVLGKGKK